MTGDKSKFLNISFKQEGHVTYGNNNKGRILGRGSIRDKDILVILLEYMALNERGW